MPSVVRAAFWFTSSDFPLALCNPSSTRAGNAELSVTRLALSSMYRYCSTCASKGNALPMVVSPRLRWMPRYSSA